MDARPTLREFIARTQPELAASLAFIQPDPDWGFLIMVSNAYPEVGIAVADRHKDGGPGLMLAVKSDGECAEFRAPCGSDGWHKKAWGADGRMHWLDKESRDESVALIRKACAEKGIRFLVLSDWRTEMEQDVDGLCLIDPYKGGMKELDPMKFRAAFGQFWHMGTGDINEAVPLPDQFFAN